MEDGPREDVSLDVRVPEDFSLDGYDVPPREPDPPREPARPPAAGRIVRFAPWFFAIAAIVAIERISMLVVVSESFPIELRAAAFATFAGMVLLVMTVGGYLFARNFHETRREH